jgi:hypothetical protein
VRDVAFRRMFSIQIHGHIVQLNSCELVVSTTWICRTPYLSPSSN